MQKRTHCKFVIISISAEVIRLFRIKVFTHVKFGKRGRGLPGKVRSLQSGGSMY